MRYEILINGIRREVEFSPSSDASSAITARIDGRTLCADAVQISSGVYSILIGGRSVEVRVEIDSQGVLAHACNREFRITIEDPRSWRKAHGGGIEPQGRQKLVASMPGKIVRVLVEVGQQVEAGQGLLVVEAMKMQNEIRSSKSGTVERLAQQGQTVNAGDLIAIVA